MLSSCRPTYSESQVDGKMITIDAAWDKNPDQEALAVLTKYKNTIDSTMNSVIGVSDQRMGKGNPESLLSNLVADILRESATPVVGQPTDIGIINMGGLRSDLPKGDITRGHVFEILPFENSLCILAVEGKVLKELFTTMALKGGEGISGAQLTITKSGKLLSATINNEPIIDDKIYSISTIDYAADGNDGFGPLAKANYRICPENGLLRDLFMRYVEQKTLKNEVITSSLDGRITVK